MKKEITKDKIENNRTVYIDIARGIAIILMVIGHVVKNGIFRNFIFSFHMPLFIFSSGLMFKENEKIKDSAIKIFKKLIFPYLICTLLIDLIKFGEQKNILPVLILWFKQIIFSYSYQKNIYFGTVLHTGVLWFIPLLVLIKLIFKVNKKICKSNDYFLSLVVMIETYIGYILGKKGYWLPCRFDVVLFSIIFFYIGYIFKKYNLLEKILKDNIAVIFLFLLWLIGIKYGDIELATRNYILAPFCIVTAISGVLIIFKISKFIENKFNKLTKILSWYGKNSMYILLIHQIEISTIPYKSFINIKNPTTAIIIISIIKLTIITSVTVVILEFLKLKKVLLEKINIKIEDNKKK